MNTLKKRETAYKLRIGDILRGSPIVEDIPQETPNPNSVITSPVKERFRFLELEDKRIIRVNIIANIVEKYQSEGEKKYASITIDDASGQIRLKTFGEDTAKLENFSQGDTILVIGVLRSYNGEIYILPEIVKAADPRYLLVRKLEIEKSLGIKREASAKQPQDMKLKDQILEIIKSGESTGGVSTEEIILRVKSSSPEAINEEIVKLIEDGIAYEPRPGKVRYLG